MTTATKKNREDLAAKLEDLSRPLYRPHRERLQNLANRYRWARDAYRKAASQLHAAKVKVLLENEIVKLDGSRIAKLDGLHSAPDGQLLLFNRLVNAKLEELHGCDWSGMSERIARASRDMTLKQIRLLYVLPIISKITTEELHDIMRDDELRNQAVELLLDHGRDQL